MLVSIAASSLPNGWNYDRKHCCGTAGLAGKAIGAQQPVRLASALAAHSFVSAMTLGRLCAPNSAWARAEGAPVQHRTPAVSLQRRWQAQEAAAAAPRARWPGPAVRHRCARAPEAAQLGGNAEAAAGSGVPEPGSAEVAASVEQAEVLRSRRLITEQQQLLLESHAQPYELTKTRVGPGAAPVWGEWERESVCFRAAGRSRVHTRCSGPG